MASGFGVADNEIVKRVAPGDLVVTADIPLAAEVIAKATRSTLEASVIQPIRFVEYSVRDFMDTMRASGNVGGGPPPLALANRSQ